MNWSRKACRTDDCASRSDYAATRATELIIVAVGTLDADEEWDGDIVRAAVRDIAADPQLPRDIVIRSTLMPGTAAALAAGGPCGRP